jgi:hypothetical protein
MKKKKPEVYFNPIDGSAPLSIYWYDGPKGDAKEAKNERGVGFFSPSGDLLGVIFDDVSDKKDRQHLTFDRCMVEVEVNKGAISHSVKQLEPPTRATRSPKKRDENVA